MFECLTNKNIINSQIFKRIVKVFSLIKKTPINLGEYGGFNTCINCGEDTYKSGWGCSNCGYDGG